MFCVNCGLKSFFSENLKYYLHGKKNYYKKNR